MNNIQPWLCSREDGATVHLPEKAINNHPLGSGIKMAIHEKHERHRGPLITILLRGSS